MDIRSVVQEDLQGGSRSFSIQTSPLFFSHEDDWPNRTLRNLSTATPRFWTDPVAASKLLRRPQRADESVQREPTGTANRECQKTTECLIYINEAPAAVNVRTNCVSSANLAQYLHLKGWPQESLQHDGKSGLTKKLTNKCYQSVGRRTGLRMFQDYRRQHLGPQPRNK